MIWSQVASRWSMDHVKVKVRSEGLDNSQMGSLQDSRPPCKERWLELEHSLMELAVRLVNKTQIIFFSNGGYIVELEVSMYSYAWLWSPFIAPFYYVSGTRMTKKGFNFVKCLLLSFTHMKTAAANSTFHGLLAGYNSTAQGLVQGVTSIIGNLSGVASNATDAVINATTTRPIIPVRPQPCNHDFPCVSPKA